MLLCQGTVFPKISQQPTDSTGWFWSFIIWILLAINFSSCLKNPTLNIELFPYIVQNIFSLAKTYQTQKTREWKIPKFSFLSVSFRSQVGFFTWHLTSRWIHLPIRFSRRWLWWNISNNRDEPLPSWPVSCNCN